MATESKVYISLEFTPNPNTLKYSVNRVFMEKGAQNFTKKEDALAKSPLATKLFEISGVAGVMIGKDFVTITKADHGEWDQVHKSASDALEIFLNSGSEVFLPGVLEGGVQSRSDDPEVSEISRKIREILDQEIRPAVATDGGDITFDRFEDGVVYLQLQGSCSGCPSSTMTLKMGIETRLKQALPDVKEVVSV